MFFNKLEFMCKKNEVKISQLLNQLGLSKSAISRWRGGTLPTGDVLIQIATYLNCSIDYLLDLTDNPIGNLKDQATQNDSQRQKLIDNYEKMNENAQYQLVDYSDYMVNKAENLKSTTDNSQMIS